MKISKNEVTKDNNISLKEFFKDYSIVIENFVNRFKIITKTIFNDDIGKFFDINYDYEKNIYYIYLNVPALSYKETIGYINIMNSRIDFINFTSDLEEQIKKREDKLNLLLEEYKERMNDIQKLKKKFFNRIFKFKLDKLNKLQLHILDCIEEIDTILTELYSFKTKINNGSLTLVKEIKKATEHYYHEGFLTFFGNEAIYE